MSRMNTLSATFTVAVVLSICFFIYQSAQESESKQRKNVSGKVELAQNTSTKAVLADWTQDRHTIAETKSLVSPQKMLVEKERPTAPVFISTSSNGSTHKTITTDTPKHDKNPETPPGLPDVHFRFDRSGLSKKTRTLLDQHVTVLQDSKWSVLLQGHTDRDGTIQQNLRVGLYRAKAVKQYLIDHGVSPEQIHMISLGEYYPICTHLTVECQHQNRRVSFSLARRTLSKVSLPGMTASTHSNPVSLPKDWHTSETRTEVLSPVIIHEAEPPSTQDSTAESGQSPVSLKPSQTLREAGQLESKIIPVPVAPIVPEPVHSTPPPTMLPSSRSHSTN